MSELLRTDDDRPPVKALVVAGDPASVMAFEDIQELIQAANLDVVAISVLQAGIDKSLDNVRRFHSERNKRVTVGVIASESSLALNAYDVMTEEVEVVFQGFTPDSLPSLNNTLYPWTGIL
jgi:glutamate racemase